MVEVKQEVVCGYGVYQDGCLVCICNLERNAYLIKDILDKDNNPQYAGNYMYTKNDFIKFNRKYTKETVEKLCY